MILHTFSITFKKKTGEEENGPIALLWEFIHSYQVDIFEVSLCKITDDFIFYITHNIIPLEEKSFFTLMASKLLYYKSKSLLPTTNLDDFEETIDILPKEIIDKLLEYKKFQMVAETLSEMNKQVSLALERDSSWSEYLNDPDDTFLYVDLQVFLKTFQSFLQIQDHKKPIEILEEEIDFEEINEKFMFDLNTQKTILFLNYIIGYSILKAITIFLLILELTNQKKINLHLIKNNRDLEITFL